MIKYFCDKCGKEIPDIAYIAKICAGQETITHWVLCRECSNKLIKYLSSEPPEDEPSDTVSEPVKVKYRKLTLIEH